MANRDIVADSQSNPIVGMQYRAILDIAVLANDYPIVVTSEDSAKPYAGLGFQSYTADDCCVWRDEMAVAL